MINSWEAIIQPHNHLWDGGKEVLVRIETSDDLTSEHVPSAFVLVLDESGSMGSAAVHHDDSDGASGLSQVGATIFTFHSFFQLH